jgi:hypothetical protein
MRALALLLLTAVLALAVWFAAAGGGEPDVQAPPPAAHPEAPAAPDRAAAAAPRAAVPSAPPTAPEPAPTPATPPTAPEAEHHPNLILRVTDGNQAPIAAFRWTWRRDSTTLRGTGSEGRAELELPPDQPGELRVEAQGHLPGTATDVRGAALGAPIAELLLSLATEGLGTGIRLRVVDTAAQPVANIRLDAFALQPGAIDGAWHLGPAKWARRAAAVDGDYAVPALEPGLWGIRLVATDAAGELLPLLPWRRTFELTSFNGYVEDVVLEPGALLELEVVDAAGQAVDPGRGVALDLRLPGGPGQSRYWLGQRDGKAVRALDGLPSAGVVTTAEAVAAGSWQLEVVVGELPAVAVALSLRAGQRQRERVVVR